MWRFGIFESENNFSCQISKAFAKQNFDVLHISKNGAKALGSANGIPIVVMSLNTYNACAKSDVDVCIIEPEIKFNPNCCKCQIAVAADTCSLQSVAALNPKSVITFGVSPRSTLTVSSLNDNATVLSLQREIVDLNGKRICEQEFAEKNNPKNVDRLMATLASLILVGVPVENINGTIFD